MTVQNSKSNFKTDARQAEDTIWHDLHPIDAQVKMTLIMQM